MDQRTQELFYIEKGFSQEAGRGVCDLISKEYGGGADAEILSKALERQPQKDTWGAYSSSHCEFMNTLLGEAVEHCKMRLILENWDGFR